MDQSLFLAFSHRVLRTLPTPVCFLLFFLSPRPQPHFFSIIGGSCHKYHFCRDKSIIFVATKVRLSRQNFCRDIHVFGATKGFGATNIILSRQKFCRGKHTFVATKDVFCHDKHVKHTFVATKDDTCGSSRQ